MIQIQYKILVFWMISIYGLILYDIQYTDEEVISCDYIKCHIDHTI